MLQAMIEMQASRVLFARFAEELEGQGLDPALSSEMDRLFCDAEPPAALRALLEEARVEVVVAP